MSILNPLADLVAWAIMHIHAGLGALFGPDTGLAWYSRLVGRKFDGAEPRRRPAWSP